MTSAKHILKRMRFCSLLLALAFSLSSSGLGIAQAQTVGEDVAADVAMDVVEGAEEDLSPRASHVAGPAITKIPGIIAPGASEAADQEQVQQDEQLIALAAARTLAMTELPDAAINLWDWEGGVAMAGLMHAYEATGQTSILDGVEAWMQARLAEGTVYGHANHATPAWALWMLHQHRPNPAYQNEVARAVSYLMYRAKRVQGTLAHYDDQLWDDTLIVSVPLLARFGTQAGCQACLDRAVSEVQAHSRRLQDPRTGRWFHGWDASDQRIGVPPHLSGAHWARGNAWAALATVEVLDQLPAHNGYAQQLKDSLNFQLLGLATLQQRDGLWHTVVTRPDFYLEASGSAGIATAMTRGVDMGWVDPTLGAFARPAYSAVKARVAADGTLTQVSAGTGVAPTIEVYNTVPTDKIQPIRTGFAPDDAGRRRAIAELSRLPVDGWRCTVPTEELRLGR